MLRKILTSLTAIGVVLLCYLLATFVMDQKSLIPALGGRSDFSERWLFWLLMVFLAVVWAIQHLYKKHK